MIRNLNALRFILILMIMISHSILPPGRGLHDYLGEYPVALFFIISGFVLSLSYGERLQKGEVSNKHFFLSRVFKLYPLNFFILALTLPLDWRLGRLESLWHTLAHFMLLQCWVPTHHFVGYINGSAWFISDIIFFYLIFKYLYRWVMQRRLSATMPVMGLYMAGYLILSYYLKRDFSSSFIYFYPLFRLIDFCIGIFLYKFYREKYLLTDHANSASFPVKTNITDMLIPLMAVGFYYLSVMVQPNLRCAALYWIPSAVTVYYMAVTDRGAGWLTRLLHNRLLLWLGSISFEIYLCHEICFRIVLSIIVHLYGEPSYTGITFAISLAFTILMAWATKKHIVSPCYQLLEKYVR